MDKSEIFVKMCEKAEEIQRRPPSDISGLSLSNSLLRVFITTNAVNIPFYDLEGNCWFIRNNEKSIWLPRQDQLQEIAFEHLKQKYPAYEQGKIVKYNYNTFDLLNSFTNFIADFEHIVVHNEEYSLLETTSNERLWLMLVMKKLYNKTWNGKEWIKKEE